MEKETGAYTCKNIQTYIERETIIEKEKRYNCGRRKEQGVKLKIESCSKQSNQIKSSF